MSIKLGSGGIVIPYSQAYVGNNLVFTKDVGDALLTETNRPITTESGEYIDYESVPYTMLEWIQSSGTQWIDTGINAGSNIRIVTEQAMWSINAQTGNQYSTSYRNRWGTNSENKLYIGFGGTNLSSSVDYIPYQKYKFDIKSGAQYCYDNSGTAVVSGGVSTNTYNTNYTYPIFAQRNGSSIAWIYPMRVYSYKMYNGNTLVRDFIPVLDSNNVACMYDLVTKEFFYNQGTGTFITSRTQPAQALQYIESSATQWIDTEIEIRSDLAVDCEWMPTGSRAALNGAYAWAQSTGTRAFCFGLYSNNKLYNGVGSSTSSTITGYVNTKYKSIGSKTSMATYQNGTVVASQSGTLGNYTDMNFFLFACCNANKGAAYRTIQRIYYCKLYRNNILVGDYIPALDENNVACMFDNIKEMIKWE